MIFAIRACQLLTRLKNNPLGHRHVVEQTAGSCPRSDLPGLINHDSCCPCTDVFSESVDCGALQVKAEAPLCHGWTGYFLQDCPHQRLPSLFQVSDVNTGDIRWNNAD